MGTKLVYHAKAAFELNTDQDGKQVVSDALASLKGGDIKKVEEFYISAITVQCGRCQKTGSPAVMVKFEGQYVCDDCVAQALDDTK